MAERHPHLIILGGPDGGRTIVVDRLPVTVGRLATCQIRLAEQYISREHFRLAASAEGVVLDVLSGAGVRIAGHKYRKGKHILLATGDVVDVGAETEILFVAADDDPKAALADLEAARAAAAAARQAEPPPAELVEEAELPEAELPEAETPEAPEAEAEPLTPARQAELQRKQRMRKILIGLGVYLALLAIGAVLLSIWSSSTTSRDAGGPALEVLTKEEMLEHLKRPEAGLSANSQEADRAAAEARRLFTGRHIHAGDTYRCIRQYIRYKAFAGDRLRFEVASDQTNFDTALNELTAELWPAYQRACLESRQGRWHAAKDEFERVRDLVPDQNDPINRNVQRHLKRVYDRIRKSKRNPEKEWI